VPAVLNLPGPRLVRLGLGAPPEVRLAPEPHMRWVLADYPARRDEQWRLPPAIGGPILLKLWFEERAKAPPSPLLTRLIEAWAFYGPIVAYARHLARECLADADLERRMASILALGTFGEVDMLPALEPLLASENPAVRCAAILAVAKLAPADRFDALQALARGEGELEAIVALGRERRAAADRGDVPAFVRVNLRHDALYEDLAGMAHLIGADIMRAFASPELPADERRRAARLLGLVRLGTSATAGVGADLVGRDDVDRALRLECVVMLGRIGARRAVPRLAELLDGADLGLSDAAVNALGEIGDVRALGPLLNHYDARRGAVRPLVEMGIWRLAAPLDAAGYAAWSRGELDLRPDTAYFFDGGLRTTVPRDLCLRLLASPDREAQLEAALLLGLLGTPADAAPLRDLANRALDDVTRAVAERAASLCAARAVPPTP